MLNGICNAQNNELSYYSVQKLSPDEGLSQGANYFRFEDSKGFMWITANDAINRYDGSQVKVYNLNRYFSNCPNLQQGYGFAEDPEANIYIGSERGLYIYSRKTDKFTLQRIFENSPDDVAMPFAYKDDKIWCFNRFYQLATYNVKTKAIKPEAKINLDTLNSIHIYQIVNNVFYYRFPVLDNEGNIWLAGKNKVAVYNTFSQKTSFPVMAKSTDGQYEFFSSCYDTINAVLSIGTNHGILQYDKRKNETKTFTHIDNVKLGIITSIAASKNLIAFSSADGLAFSKPDFSQTLWVSKKDLSRPSYIFQLSFDKSGRLWDTEDGKGQKIYSFKEKLFHKIPDDYNALPFIKNPVVASITELPNNNIVFHSQWQLNRTTSEISKFPGKDFDNVFHRSVADTVRGGNWFYSEANAYTNGVQTGIFFRNPQGAYKLVIKATVYYTLGHLQDLAVLPEGNILTGFSSGLYWLNDDHLVAASQDKAVFKINVISNDRIAVSRLNNHMLLYKVENGKNLVLQQNILPGVQSFYMQENSKTNQFWVGTNSGVYLLDSNFAITRHFDANNGLAGTYIYGLLLDDYGNVWCSHQRGLSSINGADLSIINYDKSDGIQDWDFNNRSFYKAKDGTLYFGGINGANYFKPPVQSRAYYNPEVYIDEILVNGAPVLPALNADQIQKLTLDNKQNNISVSVVVRDLENAWARQIIYRLKEKGNDWTTLGNKATINFTSMEPGDYTLELGVVDKFSNKKIIQKSLSIEIAAPFYEKVWFWVLAAIVITGISFWLFSRRRQIKQQRIFQQHLELLKQRQKITADLHDDIGASLSSLQINSMVASQLLIKDKRQQAQQVLEKIENQSKNIAEKIGDIIWSMKPGKDEFMTLSSRIRNFANDILGATNIHYSIDIEKEIDERVKDFTMRKNIVLIIKEAVNNAAKYSKASTLNIALRIQDDDLFLKVQDNGIGYSATGTGGNGMANMEKRARELNGSFKVTGEPNRGTTISCTLPLAD